MHPVSVSRRAFVVPLLAAVAFSFAAAAVAGAKPKKDDADRGGGIWDLRALEQTHEIVKTTRDDTANTVTWLLEKRADGYFTYEVAFYDADDVKVSTAFISFTPGNAAKGERTRGTVQLPAKDVMKKIKRAVATKK